MDFLGFRSGRLTRDTDIFSTGIREYTPSTVDPRIILRVDGNQDVAFLKFSFVALGDKLGYPLANQCAGDAADSSTDCGSAQSGDDGSRRYKWTNSGNRQGTNPGNPAERTTNDATGPNSRDRTFRSLGADFSSAKSWDDSLSGNKAEMSFFEKSARFRHSRISSA